jgi:DNA-binding transcriptional ArsR family regulator
MEHTDTLLAFCKALADESRLKIVGLLAAAEHNVQQLAARLNLKEPTISHHLSVLKEVGLARLRVERNTHWYSLDPAVLHNTSRQLFDRKRLATLAVPAIADDYERKVMTAFVEGERLTKIPDSLKKRRVILKWLAGYFAPGCVYSEAEVNSVIKQHHEDAATLRREMVGCHILTREQGRYRLLPNSEWR